MQTTTPQQCFHPCPTFLTYLKTAPAQTPHPHHGLIHANLLQKRQSLLPISERQNRQIDRPSYSIHRTVSLTCIPTKKNMDFQLFASKPINFHLFFRYKVSVVVLALLLSAVGPVYLFPVSCCVRRLCGMGRCLCFLRMSRTIC